MEEMGMKVENMEEHMDPSGTDTTLKPNTGSRSDTGKNKFQDRDGFMCDFSKF